MTQTQLVKQLYMLVIVLESRLTPPCSGKPTIETTTETIAIKGSPVELVCSSNRNHKYCLFSKPNESRLNYIDPQTMSLFDNYLQPITISKNKSTCGIQIENPNTNHSGTWSCLALLHTGKKSELSRIKKFFLISIRATKTQYLTNKYPQILKGEKGVAVITIMLLIIVSLLT